MFHVTNITCGFHVHSDKHSSPLWWFWGPQGGVRLASRNPPCLCLCSLKAAPACRDFFPKALLHEFFLGMHTPELSTALRSLMSALPQLLTQRAGPLSLTQSCYCPSSMGALAAHNTEQLTNWEQPCWFLSFVFACGGMLFCLWKSFQKNLDKKTKLPCLYLENLKVSLFKDSLSKIMMHF